MKGQRQQVVLQRGAHAAQPSLETPNLSRPLFDALSQSLKVRRQDRALFTSAHRERGGICLACGLALRDHFSDSNHFLKCAQVAQKG